MGWMRYSLSHPMSVITVQAAAELKAHPAKLQAAVAELGSWITGFEVDGQKYGGGYFPEYDPRALQFCDRVREKFGERAVRILECGCLEGGHTVVLGRRLPQARVLATDVRDDNLAKAQLHAALKGVTNIDWLRDDLDAEAVALRQPYDAVFSVGLVYHLARPEVYFQRVAAATSFLWLWTVVSEEADAVICRDIYRGRIYTEDVSHPLSAVRTESFFPTLGSLLQMIFAAGFKESRIYSLEQTKNGNGPAVLLEASK